MNREERIEKEVQKTLACFRNAEQIKVDPFFCTRLQARIQALETKKYRLWIWDFTSEYLQPAILLIFLAANIFTATVILGSKNTESPSRSEILKTLAEDYSLHQEETFLLTFVE